MSRIAGIMSWVGGALQHCAAIVFFFSLSLWDTQTLEETHTHTYTQWQEWKSYKGQKSFLCVSLDCLATRHQAVERKKQRERCGGRLCLAEASGRYCLRTHNTQAQTRQLYYQEFIKENHQTSDNTHLILIVNHLLIQLLWQGWSCKLWSPHVLEYLENYRSISRSWKMREKLKCPWKNRLALEKISTYVELIIILKRFLHR